MGAEKNLKKDIDNNVKYIRYWQLPACVHAKSLQSCLTLCNSMDHSPPGSSVQRILQARILKWVAIFSTRESSQPRAWTQVYSGSSIARRFFPSEPLGKPNSCLPSVYFLSILLKKTLTLPTIIKAIAEVYSTTFYKRTTLSCSPRIQGCYEMQSSQWDISYAFLGVFVFLFFIYSSFGLLYGCTNVLLGGAAILTRDN